MRIEKLTLGPLESNCYFIIDEKDKKTMIVDPGDDGNFIIERLERNGLIPSEIIATHGHFDHTGAVFELESAYNIPFYMHKKDIFLLKRLHSTVSYFTKNAHVLPPRKVNFIKEGEVFKLGSDKLKVIESPGHTPGSISLLSNEGKVAFVGDLIFADGSIGRSDFKYSNKDSLLKSVRKVLKWNKEIIIYPGHGQETSVAKLDKKMGDMLRG